jgi:aldehyde:ferredoxin oxidoreductase
MPFGWTGKILRVDLSSGKTWTEDTEPYTRRFIGGKGINVKIMYDEVGPDVGPFDPENRICFGPGVLTGTAAPSHSRMKLTSISPNGNLQNSGIGGHIPAEIKRAGYDNVVIQGASDRPVYLSIANDKVEIKDAAHIWGKGTQGTQRVIKEELGESAKVLCIGPAGENLVSFGCVITGFGSTAGRGGFGAIMGSKNLKAIAVKGAGQVRIAQPEKFLAACRDAHTWFVESDVMKIQSKEGQGDSLLLQYGYDAGGAVVGNWEEAEWPTDFADHSEFYRKYATLQYGCQGCPVHHYHIFDIPGRCKGATKCVQWVSFAGPVWVKDRAVMVHANVLCNDYGMDSESTANAVGFLMELYYRGIITEKDTDGIPMNRGDERAILSVIEKIARQEGFGKLFRNGVWGAAKNIGDEAEECAMVVNRQEMENYDYRAFISGALAAAVSDGTATYGQAVSIELSWFADKEKAENEALSRYGAKGAAVPNSYDKARAVWNHENINTAIDLTGTCNWLIPASITYKLDVPARLLSLSTGHKTTEADLLWAAERVLLLERAFRALRGGGRDTLPNRLFKAAVPYGIFKGERLDRDKFERMLDEYYECRGWDKNGIPAEETFTKFDLTEEWKRFNKTQHAKE